jgi:ammonia channel protein AmtB
VWQICSGAASLAYTLVLRRLRVTNTTEEEEDIDEDGHLHRGEARSKGAWKRFLFPSRRRRQANAPDAPVEEIELEGHNMTTALLGAMLVWFGWFGFNAGSELRANSRAASTFIASNLAACSGGIAFTLLEQYVARGKWSGVGFCIGAFAGLVAITPGAGWVSYLDVFSLLSGYFADSIRFLPGQVWFLV